MMEPDQKLVERVWAGEREAFARLIDRYKTRVLHTAFRMLRNREDAEEAAQDTFVRAYRGLAKFRAEASFSTWIYKICYHVCLSYLERKKLPRAQIEPEELLSLPDWATPETTLETQAQGKAVEAVLDGLPQHFRTVLILYHAQQLSYQEISEVMELPVNTVKTHLHRGRALLRERILQTLPEEEIVF